MTRQEIRNLLRGRLNDWPQEDKLTSACEDTDITLFVENVELHTPGRKIQIDSEVMKVTEINALLNQIKVQRGYEGTAKVPHANGTLIFIFDEYTDQALNDKINNGILALWPAIYLEVVDETLITDGSARYSIPISIDFIHEVYLIQDDFNICMLMRAWKAMYPQGKLEFAAPIAEGYKIRLVGGKRLLTLNADNESLPIQYRQDLEMIWIDMILDHAMASLLAEREAQRTKFTEYAALLNERASRPAELGATSKDFMQRFMLKRSENAVLKHGYRRRL